jgi:hypothetical protein
LAHAAALLQQPLLPAQDLVLFLAASPAEPTASEAAAHLLLYCQSCLALQPYPGGASKSDAAPAWPSKRARRNAEAAQMAMLAFILWSDVVTLQSLSSNGKLDVLKVRPAVAISLCPAGCHVPMQTA